MNFSHHALQRLVQRKALQSDVIDTINTGVKLKHRADPDNKCTFVNNKTGLMVVTNIDVTLVITVWWKG